MLNHAVLIGRLTKDPEGKFLQTGTAVTSFTLAVDRTFKSKDGEKGTDFIPIVAWGKTAELASQYLSKGKQTAVSGRIQTRSYDAKDGTKRYVTEIVADEITFLGSKDSQQTEKATVNEDDFTPIDEDAPF